ncbi:hypothetical protein [Denitrificimonas caeni]|uniref:hypothetical protein n=1 Tax=Denitrificimonas caeni TaxID=521720 RepID=UPI00196343EA|nr:hypothetical protein [Denitrificimonas caeni]
MNNMTTWFENATKFFHQCESAKGWESCKQYVADDAEFICQSGTYADVHTVEGYVSKIAEVYYAIFREGTDYVLEDVTHNEKGTIAFFGTSIIKHTGPDGPVAPTGKVAKSHFAYFLSPDENGKVARMIKVYDEAQTRSQLGWPAK